MVCEKPNINVVRTNVLEQCRFKSNPVSFKNVFKNIEIHKIYKNIQKYMSPQTYSFKNIAWIKGTLMQIWKSPYAF